MAPAFIPARRLIDTISAASNAEVTTQNVHGFLSGLIIRLVFPTGWGMSQLQGKLFEITVNSPTTFLLGVNSSKMDPYSPIGSAQVGQVIPVAEEADTLSQSTRNNNNIIPER